MAIRVVRHLGARAVPEDTGKVLNIMVYGAGEDLRHLRMDYYGATQDDTHADQASEVNWTVLAVPWHIILTHSNETDVDWGSTNMDESEEWDKIYRSLLYSADGEADGNEYYGGNYDSGAIADAIHAPMEHSEDSGDSEHYVATADEPKVDSSLGPMGPIRLFSKEVLLRPLLSEGSGKVRWFDDGNVTIHRGTGYQSGGVILVGAHRYENNEETNFSARLVDVARRAFGPLIGGDMSRVQHILRNDTTSRGDWLRTAMFGGDNYIEASTLQGSEMKCYTKVWASFTTPYKLDVI